MARHEDGAGLNEVSTGAREVSATASTPGIDRTRSSASRRKRSPFRVVADQKMTDVVTGASTNLTPLRDAVATTTASSPNRDLRLRAGPFTASPRPTSA